MRKNLSPTALQNLKPTDKISLLGGSGFVGSSLVRLLLPQDTAYIAELNLATRNKSSQKLQKLTESHHSDTEVTIIECDQTNGLDIQEFLKNSSIVINLAGLAWQHPGGILPPKKDLFIQEVFQNSVSALLIGSILQKGQTLVWTSTSAIDGMFARLSTSEKEELESEATDFSIQLLNELDVKKNKEDLYTALQRIIDTYPFKSWPAFPGSTEKTCFAFEYSYAYSKYIGQLILEELSKENIEILKISDVYGPGQDISERILDPLLPARRVQRYIAVFREISKGNSDWIPNNGGNLYGLYRDKNNHIFQSSWSDWVFPTHIDDVCEMIIRSLTPKIQKTVLNVNGNRISNRNLMEIIAAYFKTQIIFNKNEAPTHEMVQNSEDLPILQMNTNNLIAFEDGLNSWIEESN